MDSRILYVLAACSAVGLMVSGCRGSANALADGLERLKQGDARRAADLLGQAVRRHPESATAHANLGIALWRCGRPRQALTPLRTAAALVADDPRPKLLLGSICMEMNRLDDAYAAFDAARNTAPDLAEPLNDLGVVEYRRGQFGRASAWFQAAINANSNYPPALYNLALTLQANPTNAPRATPLLRRYVAVAGDDPRAADVRKTLGPSAEPASSGSAPPRTTRRPSATSRGQHR